MTAPAAMPVLITVLTFISVSATVVFTRLYTRTLILKNVGIDDWMMFAALCAAIIFTVVVCFQIKYGLGVPFADLLENSPQNIPKFFQTLWATIPMYNLALVLTKISIVLQYMRIFTQKKIRRICLILIGVLIVYGTWTIFGSFFMCLPVAYFWDKTIDGHCMNQLAFWFSNAALNICTDIMVFAFPMPLLKALQLPRNQKIGLMIVFAFGGFVCVTSIIRLKSLYEISVSPDTTLDGVNAAIWSSIEINVAISCASLPAIKPLISLIFPKLLGSSLRSRNNGSNLDASGSHHLSNFHKSQIQSQNGSGSGSSGLDEIKVVQHIVQEREVRDDGKSAHGSERSLVWKCDCYSEEQHQKSHSHV